MPRAPQRQNGSDRHQTAATATAAKPTPTSTPVGPTLEDSENYDLLLSELFPVRDAYGLLTERWKRVAAAPGSQVESVERLAAGGWKV